MSDTHSRHPPSASRTSRHQNNNGLACRLINMKAAATREEKAPLTSSSLRTDFENRWNHICSSQVGWRRVGARKQLFAGDLYRQHFAAVDGFPPRMPSHDFSRFHDSPGGVACARSFSAVLYPSSREIAFRGLPASEKAPPDAESPRRALKGQKEIEVHRRLGSGGFGTVYLGSCGHEKVAVKLLHKQRRNSTAMLQSIVAETRMLEFRHPNIVRTLRVTPFTERCDGGWILMEFVGSRNLQSLIDDPAERLSQDRRLKFGQQIAKALDFIHARNFVHLDVKPANIITANDVCKLGDFGCSQRLVAGESGRRRHHKNALTGTVAYSAPEMLKGYFPSVKADIYSLGITLWQLLSREIPYGRENVHVIIFGVVAYHLRPAESNIPRNNCENWYRELYRRCWQRDPSDRPDSCELVHIFETWANS